MREQSIKKQRHHSANKGTHSQSYSFSSSNYRCQSWTITKAERWRIYAFEVCCWRRLLRVPWTARRSNQSILKEISPDVHWKDWCWIWSSNTLATWCKKLTHWKWPWSQERLKAGRKGDDRWLDGITDSMHMSMSKLLEIVKNKKAWHAEVYGVAKNQTWLSNWTIKAACLTHQHSSLWVCWHHV